MEEFSLNQDKVLRGIFFILLSALGFAGVSLFVKLSGDIGAAQKAFFRNIVAAFIAFLMMKKNGASFEFEKSKLAALILRSSLGTAGILLSFYSVDHLLLGDANILQKISPFIVIVLSVFVFKEKISRVQVFYLMLGFIGIALVIKPSGSELVSLGALAGIAGAFCAGAAYTCVRYLAKMEVNGSFIVFFFSAFSVVVLLPYVLLHYQPMSLYQWAMVAGIGLCSALGQFGITYGYAAAAAKSISVFEYSQVIFAALFGFAFFSEIPDILSLIGYVIISGVGVLMVLRGARESRQNLTKA